MNKTEENALSIVRSLQTDYPKTYFVGGYVRDRIMNLSDSKDIDIVTEALPGQIKEVLDKAFPGSTYVEVGESFGIVMIVLGEERFEIATFRSDGEYKDNRHPESVSFASDKEDAARRDFTMNAIFYDPINLKTIDYFNGIDDINLQKIRAVGDPSKRFQEDALRMLRAIRFAAQKNFRIEDNTLLAIKENAGLITSVSKERIKEEMDKIFLSHSPGLAIKLLKETGLLFILFPDVDVLDGVKQNPVHHPEGNVYVHSILAVQLAEKDLMLKWALFFHDIGKTYTTVLKPIPGTNETKITHPGHAAVSKELAKSILKDYKFSNLESDIILWLIEKHDIFLNWKPMSRAKKVCYATNPLFHILLDHYLADRQSSLDSEIIGQAKELIADIKEFMKMVDNNPIVKHQAIKFTMVNGKDLMSLGIQEGPILGKIISDLKEKFLNQELDTKSEMTTYVKDNYLTKEEEKK